MAIGRKRTASGLLLLAAAVVVAGVGLTSVAIGTSGNANADDDTTGDGGSSTSEDCKVYFYSLHGDKDSPLAFGPAIKSEDADEIRAELHERRSCGEDGKADPALTAAHYADWSAAGLTDRKVAYSEIDAFTKELIDDRALWGSVVKEMESFEDASTVTIEDVPAGTPTLYMESDDHGGVLTKQGKTLHDGTNVVFTHLEGKVVKLRLDCGAQNNWIKPVPDVPKAECQEDCKPKPTPTPTPTKTTEQPKPTPTPTPTTVPKKPSESTSQNPAVPDWIKDEPNPQHSVNTNDGATDSKGYQQDPQQDAQKAEEAAQQQNQQTEQSHEESVQESDESGAGTVTENQEQTESTPVDQGW
ncbi:MAG: hypothetical protein JWN33_215 [Candidatus Saccharibacteria bacterium]|nr:hypothetical protein [Candidatus Saccharibacteria bacterium]